MATENKKSSGHLVNVVKDNPIAASILSKLVKEKTQKQLNPLTSNIPAIALETSDKLSVNEDIVKMFPDVELCIQILVSSIISPNDMTSSKLLYQAPDLKLPAELKKTIIKTIEDHIEKYYDLNTKLPTILREAIFTKGAYIEAVIPEASLDDVISQYNYNGNITLEHYLNTKLQPTYQFLGPSVDNNKFKISTESRTMFNISTNNPIKEELIITQEDLFIDITDNYKILNLHNTLIKSKEKQSRMKIYGKKLSTENDDILNSFFRDPGYGLQQDVVQIKGYGEASRESIGRPLVIKLPVESVIPVHVVNDPTKHLGYFVLLDDNGTPVTQETSFINQDEAIVTNLNNKTDQGMGLISKASQALFGMTQRDIILDNIEETYSKIVENLILKKLQTGMYGDLATIKDQADIYRVMFIRALKSQRTKLLFLPSELVAYYAFEFRDNGTGKSLLEKTSVLYSLRSILLFSRIMSSIKNSTPITEVSATLDEDDPDPEKSMEDIISEVLKTRQNMLPLGVIRPDDLSEWAHRLGVRFKFQHPSIANIDIQTSDVNSSKVLPDDELEQKIKEMIIMSYGLTPEIVESGYASDFATTVTAKNLLTAKRVTRTQEMFNTLVTDHVRKLAQNDDELISAIKEVIKNNKKDITNFLTKLKKKKDANYYEKFNKVKLSELTNFITNIFISEIEVYLPTVQPYEANSSKNAFDDFKTMVEESMDIIFNTESLPDEYVGNFSGKIDTIKGMFKAVIFRKWMIDNNYLPEIGEFLTKDDDGKPVFNAMEEHNAFIEAVIESLLPFMKERLKLKAKADEKLQKIEDAANDSGGDDYGSDDDSYGDDSGDEGSDDTGDDEGAEGGDEEGTDDAGGDMDMGDEGGDEGEAEGDEGDSVGKGGGDDFDMDMDMGGDDEGGGKDEGGGDDMGMDMDMGMGDDEGGGDSGSKDKGHSTVSKYDEETTKKLGNIEVKINEAKLTKMQADAKKAIADARLRQKDAGLTDEEINKEVQTDESAADDEGLDKGKEGDQANQETPKEGDEDDAKAPEKEPDQGDDNKSTKDGEGDDLGEDNIGGDQAVIKIPKLKPTTFNLW